MRVFLYEHITGGGMWRPESESSVILTNSATTSLLAEGAAMIRALAADFVALAGIEVLTLRDRRLDRFELPGCRCLDVGSREEADDLFARLAGDTEVTILIAPESDGELLNRARRVTAVGGKLLSPGPEFVELAADKHRTAEFLRLHEIPAPQGIVLGPGEPLPLDFPYPAVIKPVDGAGSCDARLVLSRTDCQSVLEKASDWQSVPQNQRTPLRLERFHPGRAVSLAVLTGPAGHVCLPGCDQLLSDDGCLMYLGGKTPLPPAENARARRLVEACLAVLPQALGYIGFDLVLGADTHGGDDVVIEINPRLTTSYVGLRALSGENLAAAMLAVAGGRLVELPFAAGPIEFRANGALVS